MNVLFDLPECQQSSIYSNWLSLKSVNILDTALCSNKYRGEFLNVIQNQCTFVDKQFGSSPAQFKWVILRRLKMKEVKLYGYVIENDELCASFLRECGNSVESVTLFPINGNENGYGICWSSTPKRLVGPFGSTLPQLRNISIETRRRYALHSSPRIGTASQAMHEVAYLGVRMSIYYLQFHLHCNARSSQSEHCRPIELVPLRTNVGYSDGSCLQFDHASMLRHNLICKWRHTNIILTFSKS